MEKEKLVEPTFVVVRDTDAWDRARVVWEDGHEQNASPTLQLVWVIYQLLKKR